MDKRAFIEKWYTQVWTEENLGAIDQMMAPKAQVHGLLDLPSIGPAEFRGFAEAILQQLKEVSIATPRVIEQGDWISILMEITAKCRKTDTPMQFFGLAMARIEDDKIQEAFNYVDFISMYEKLGLMPEHTMRTCLSGTALPA